MNAPTPDPTELALGDSTRPRRRSRIERATYRQEAVRMRRDGMTPEMIAAELGVHRSTVFAWISDAIKSLPQEAAEELRVLELQRLDLLVQGHLPLAANGDDKAAMVVLRTMERRAKLLNLDEQSIAAHEQVGTLLDRLIAGPPTEAQP